MSGRRNCIDNDEWILFPKRLHPIVHDAIMSVARRDGIRPKCTHDAVTSDKSLWFETYVIMRKGDDSRLTNQFVRTLLRKFKVPPQAGSQMELSLSA